MFKENLCFGACTEPVEEWFKKNIEKLCAILRETLCNQKTTSTFGHSSKGGEI